MALRPQPLAIQFSGGVETKIDSKQVPPLRLLELENATFIKQSTLAKRNGYRAYSMLVQGDAETVTDPIGMASRGDELLTFTAERAYSYRPEADRWVDTGEVASVEVIEAPIGRTGTAQTMPDHATNQGVTVVAWEDSRGGVYASVVEAATGRILLADTLLDANGISPRCVAAGTNLHVYWQQSTNPYIMVCVVNPAAPTAALVTAVLTDDVDLTNRAYDATITGDYFSSEPSLIAWVSVAGVRIGYVHPSGVLGGPVTNLPSVATFAGAVTGPVACTFDLLATTTPRVGIILVTAGNVAAATLDEDDLATIVLGLSDASGTNAIRACCSFDDAGQLWWAVERTGARNDLNSIATNALPASGVAMLLTTRIIKGHGLVSSAFIDDGNVYTFAAHSVTAFPYIACVRLSGDEIGGAAVTPCYYRSFVGQFPGLTTRKHVACVQPVDGTAGISRDHAVAISYRIQLDSEDGDQFGEEGIKLATLDFEADAAYQSAEIGRGLYLAGACASHYDGRRWAEDAFHTAPDTDGGTIAIEGAAGALGAGTYGYKLVYEEIDAQGELHQSAPSLLVNVTIAASKKVTLTVPMYRLTSKRRVRVGVYRSEQGATGDPDSIEYFRVTSLDPAATGDNGFIANDPSVDSVTFTDNLPDATLTTREPLYTNGGILPNDPSPMRGGVIAGGMSRLFWTDPTDPHLVRYSQQIADETGLESPIAFSQTTDPYGGRVVGIGVIDGAVIAFCETAIYGWGGPGPARAPFASADAFSPSELITSDVGCKSPNSICQGPEGIYFQSEKGIKLLNRSRQVEDVGSAVYSYNDQTITRATLLPDRHQVVFLTDSGSTLLYDYERKQWSTFTNHEGIDARVIGGVYHYLRTDGRVFAETPGEYLDDNRQIRLRIGTAWLHFAEYLQAWQRVLSAYFIGEYKSAHTLIVRFRTSYDVPWSAPIEIDVDSNYNPDDYGAGAYGDELYGGAAGDVIRYQRGLHLNRECQSIQFRIEDREATDAAGASFELSELLIWGGVLFPAPRLGASRQQ